MMSGHNAICVATALIESGMVPVVGDDPREPTKFTLEAPAGPIEVMAKVCRASGKALEVTLRNTASFVPHGGLGVQVDVPGGVGPVEVDVAYGGMWYAIVDAASVGLDLVSSRGRDICRLGEMIKVQGDAKLDRNFRWCWFWWFGRCWCWCSFW